ncbi:MAG: TetR/AcrR family transcriptional regulator [Gammaproteobacteria bacterium]
MSARATKTTYHHGDLRRALVANALALLETRVDGDVSLREVARSSGVSATAVYRHFPDKDALYAALAAEGFERLADAQEAAAAHLADRLAAFRASGRAYVHFALANPALFRLMSSCMHLAGATPDDSATRGNRARRLLLEHVAALMPAASEAERMVTVVQAWALVHGLAVLMLGGQIPPDAGLIEAAVADFRPGT